MAGWLAGDDEADRGGAAVDGLVDLAGLDFEAFAGAELEVVAVEGEREFAGQDEEELARADVWCGVSAAPGGINSSMMLRSGVRTRYQASQSTPLPPLQV